MPDSTDLNRFIMKCVIIPAGLRLIRYWPARPELLRMKDKANTHITRSTGLFSLAHFKSHRSPSLYGLRVFRMPRLMSCIRELELDSVRGVKTIFKYMSEATCSMALLALKRRARCNSVCHQFLVSADICLLLLTKDSEWRSVIT